MSQYVTRIKCHGYLNEEKVWLEMIEDRNQTSHVYDEPLAQKIVDKIKSNYFSEFKKLEKLF